MADDDTTGESRWDRLRVRLISIGLVVAALLFVLRLADDGVDLGALLVLCIPAALFLVPAGIMLRDAYQVRRWPRVPGIVVATELRPTRHPQSAAVSQRPVVRYRYTVEGVELRGDAVWFGRQEGGNERWARKVLARYPVGAAVGVHCNPADPRQTALDPAPSGFVWALVALGLLALAVALYVSGLF